MELVVWVLSGILTIVVGAMSWFALSLIELKGSNREISTKLTFLIDANKDQQNHTAVMEDRIASVVLKVAKIESEISHMTRGN